MKNIMVLFASLSVLILGVLGLGVPTVSADGPSTCVFVRETSHNIHGAFLAFYESHGGPKNLGVPLTEAFIEDNMVVQYFTYARLEFFPQNPEPFRVQLGLLGMQYGITDPPIHSETIPSLNDPNFTYFPETGLVIGFAIKQYYDSHGGRDIFGYPVSQLRYENGIFVQYFQRARLEWNPLEPGQDKVRPSAVGQFVVERRYPAIDSSARAKMPNDWCVEADTLRPTLTPTPLARVATPVADVKFDLQILIRFPQAGTRGPQYVDVFVYDRATNRPVQGVALYATIQFLHTTRVIPLMPTDANGKASFGFDMGVQSTGATTYVNINAFLGTASGKATQSFIHNQ